MGGRYVPPFCHDCVERPIERPVEDEKQRRHYSGKKKDHTLKNYLVTNQRCRIDFLSPTVEGTVSDKVLADRCRLSFPLDSGLLQDAGFQGYYPDNALEEVEILQPYRKKRGKGRTPFEKAFNRIISSSRVFVEHVIGSVKRWRCVHEICRLRRKGIQDLVMDLCCGLHNLKSRLHPWSPVPEPGAPV